MQNAECRMQGPPSRATHPPSSVAALRRVDASRITFHAPRITHHAPRSTHSAPRPSPAFHADRAVDGHRHHGHPGRHRPADASGLKPNAKVAATRQLLDAIGRAASSLSASAPPSIWFSSPLTSGRTPRLPPGTPMTGPKRQTCRQAAHRIRLCLFAQHGRSAGRAYPAVFVLMENLAARRYISPEKFIPPPSPTAPPPLVLGINANGGTNGVIAYRVYGFNYTNAVPFPAETNKGVPGARPYIRLPYIAFDATGQLMSSPSGQPELIPLSEGSVSYGARPQHQGRPKSVGAGKRASGRQHD